MLHSPDPIRIATRASHRPPALGRYSRWRCVGNLEEIEGLEHRTCLFENVCYNTTARAFSVFARAGAPPKPVVYDHKHGMQRRFKWRISDGQPVDADFAALNKWASSKHRVSWNAELLQQPLPHTHRRIRGVAALSAPFVSTNLGHVAWDEAFPLLVAMAQLGVYTPELQILRTHSCAELELRTNTSMAVCAKFAAAFLAPLTGTAPRGASEPAELQTLSDLAADSSHSTVCFDRLIVGGSFDAFNSEALNIGKEPLIALYRHRVLAWHGIDPTAVPKRHQILLVRKYGRRTIGRFSRVERFVRESYGDIANVVWTDYSAMSLTQQLALVAASTIAISPCGGISMILPFLPEGAHAILLNYMLGPKEARRHGECEGCSWSMEAELWRHVRHVHKMYYQVWGSSDFLGSNPGRDATVRVKPERLAELIDAALDAMQP